MQPNQALSHEPRLAWEEPVLEYLGPIQETEGGSGGGFDYASEIS